MIFFQKTTDFGSILGSPGAFFSNFSEKSKTLRNHIYIYICFRKGRDLQNSTKNRPKKCKKPALAGNSLKIALGITFLAKNAVFSRFWLPQGAQNGAQNAPKIDPKIQWGTPGGPRRPQRPFWGPFWVYFGSHLGPFWEHFGTPSAGKSCKNSKRQHMAANSSK